MRLSLLSCCVASLAAQSFTRVEVDGCDLGSPTDRGLVPVGWRRVEFLLPPIEVALDPAPATIADVVILIGQSNAQGFARVENLRPELREPFLATRIWRHAEREWQAVHAGHNSHELGPTPFFGCEVGIADSVATRERPVWIVKFAVSASAMGPLVGEWNEWNVRAGELYPLLWLRIAAAVADLQSRHYDPRVRMVAIVQGETDAVFSELSSRYERAFDEFCGRLRCDLRERALVGVADPVIRFAMVSPHLERIAGPGVRAVRLAQRAVAKRRVGCEAIETARFGLQPDRVHFSASGLMQLGRQLSAPGW